MDKEIIPIEFQAFINHYSYCEKGSKIIVACCMATLEGFLKLMPEGEDKKIFKVLLHKLADEK